jgi:hypothetical protein
MKYVAAKVISHPRAGSHYFAKLLNDNFFFRKDYLTMYAGHSKAHTAHLRSPGVAVFYIYRNNEDTIKSIFKIRDRFGLVANSIEEFKEKKLCDMRGNRIDSTAIYDNGNTQKVVTKVDTYLPGINMTVEEYLNDHKKFWKTRAHFIIYYDALMQDFDNCMYAVNLFLGADKTEFVNETKRIGWYDAKEGGKIFS